MNRTWSVVFGIMVFVTLTSFVYAFVQQVVASEQRRLAEVVKIEAEKNAVEAEKQRLASGEAVARAMVSEAEARKQQAIAEEIRKQLDQCQKKR